MTFGQDDNVGHHISENEKIKDKTQKLTDTEMFCSGEFCLICYAQLIIFTFRAFLFLLHLLAIFLQLLVREFGERVWTLLADDDLGLVLLLDDGLGCGHELPLQDTQRKAGGTRRDETSVRDARQT